MSAVSARRDRDDMSMTASEWLEISAVIRDRWPAAQLPLDTLRRWGADLGDLPGSQVAAALDVLYREGREFPPNAGQIRAKVAELAVDAPDFAEVVVTLRRILALPEERVRCTSGDPDAEDAEWEIVPVRSAALAREHVLIGAFVECVGWQQIHGLDGGQDEARLRSKWETFARRAQREVAVAGVEPAGLPALERVNRSPMRSALEQGTGARRALGEIEAAREAA